MNKGIIRTSSIEIPDISAPLLYGPPPDLYDYNNIPLRNINIGILILLFILGVIAFLNKKMSKTLKWIIAISLIIIGIIITLIIKSRYKTL